MMTHTIKLEIKTGHNPSATPVDGLYPVDVIRKRLLVDEVYPANLRYSSGAGSVQYTPDGTNWYNAPEFDPRNNAGAVGRKGESSNCPAAKSVAEYFRRYITLVTGILSAGSGLVQGASAILGFLNLLGGYGILWEIISGMFGTLTGYGASAIATAFTSDQYDKLTCILLCTMNDSKLDANSLTLTKQLVTEQLNATAAPIVNLMLDVMGFAGVNRAGAFYTVAGDCSGCASCDWSFCVDLDWLWAQSSPAAAPYSCPPQFLYSPQGVLGSLSGHTTWRAQKTLGDTANRFGRRFPITLPAGAVLTRIKIWFIRSAGNTDGFSKVLWDYASTVNCVNGAFHNSPLVYAQSVAGPVVETYYLGLGTTVASDGTTFDYVQIELTGTGNRPAIPYVPKYYA